MLGPRIPHIAIAIEVCIIRTYVSPATAKYTTGESTQDCDGRAGAHGQAHPMMITAIMSSSLVR